MIQIREYLTTKISKSKIKATNETIHQIVKEEMDKYGHDCDLNYVDVSEVTNMHSLFSCYANYLGKSYSDLNPDISEWNVRNVTNMDMMFYWCKKFNCNLSMLDVSNVTNMTNMFRGCTNFNQDLNNWNVSNVKYMTFMFAECKNFNQEMNKWDVSNVMYMSYMFYGCEKFDQDISEWDLSNVTHHTNVFENCPIKEEFKPHFSI